MAIDLKCHYCGELGASIALKRQRKKVTTYIYVHGDCRDLALRQLRRKRTARKASTWIEAGQMRLFED